ncbi:DedA family protein [Sulfurimonas sp. HSL-1716]|uniref:DedA family protein n=1 Tax=Hydrocurvibacter sulfurireducens TaxID=3131937 RepID=UPI0031F7A24C
MLAEFAQWLLATVFDWGYLGIFFLMAVESSFVPFPSEIILIPAGVLIADGKMNLYLVFAFSILGSLFGALVNYYLAMFVGRKFLDRFGKYFFISQNSLEKMDNFFENHGHISTFTGRLLPGIRQLISIPAGLSKMNLKIFLVYTGAGAGVWSVILIALGYFIGKNQELIHVYLKEITIAAVTAAVLLIAGYVIYKKKRIKEKEL